VTALQPTHPVPRAAAADQLVRSLRAALPYSAATSSKPEVLRAHSVDRSGWLPDGLPFAVVWASQTADVVAAVRFAAQHRLTIVPRGAGTGLSGGAAAGHRTIVLDLSRMDRILSVDRVDGLAEVEPGVITADLDRAARDVGLRYAPDPASWNTSTIGGNIATNAGGLRCAKYGVTGDAVAALTVVLADGSVVHTGRSTLKGVVGYDLTRLFVGSEGTLGIIVAATLRLSPLPVRTATASAYFQTLTHAADTVDRATLVAIDGAQGTSLADTGSAFLLVQTDGYGAQLELEAALAIIGRRAVHVEVAADDAEAERLVSTRRLALPSIEQQGQVLIGDVAVPKSRLAAAMAGIADIAADTGVKIYTFAHAGDGNLHPILVVDADHPTRVHVAEDRICRLALALGGTLSGEHGVGVLKRPWVHAEVDPVSLAAHQDIKNALDPHHIFNAGKAHVDLSDAVSLSNSLPLPRPPSPSLTQRTEA
jgi:glycolate oxidase